jgi:hypothetical protein
MITRFTLLAILILSGASAWKGDYASSIGDLAAAYAIQCNDSRFFLLSALSTIPKMRVIGLVGFLLLSLGHVEVGKIFLALHFGVVGIDDANLPVIGRLSAGAAGLSFAI